MNTRVVKSFGLALVVAVGILALMLALGTFNAPKAGAAINDGEDDTKTVTTSPTEPGPGDGIGITLVFEIDADAIIFDEITISLEDFGVPNSIEERSVSVRQGTGTSLTGAAAASVDVDGSDVTIELPDIDGDTATGLGINANTDITIVIRKNAGITAPTAPGEYAVTVAHGDTDAVELGKVTISRALTTDPTKGGSGTEIAVSGKALANGTGSLYTETLDKPDHDKDGIVDVLIEGTSNPENDNNNGWGIDVDGDGDADYHILRTGGNTAVAEDTYVAVLAEDPAITDNIDTNLQTLAYSIDGNPFEDSGATPPVEETPPSLLDASYAGEKLLEDVTVSEAAFSTMIDAEDLKFGGSRNMSYLRIVGRQWRRSPHVVPGHRHHDRRFRFGREGQ